jgi:integrase
MNALVFLYKRVLNHPLQDSINAVRADKKMNVPVIMTREEVAAVISLMDGTAQVVAKLLYGNGLRIMEAVWLRVKDVDFQRKFFQRACPLLPALDIVGIFMPHRVLPEVEHRGRQLRSRPSFKQRLQGTVCAPKE